MLYTILTLGGFVEGTCAENGYSTYVVGNIQFPMENCDVLYADVYSENTGNDFLPMDFDPLSIETYPLNGTLCSCPGTRFKNFRE